MSRHPRCLTLILALVLGLPAALPAAAGDAASPAARTFAHFKALAGDWAGHNSAGEAVRLSYRVVSNGTAVLEQLEIDGKEQDHDMVTLYHLDGDRLLLTHYCAAGNQPRMQAVELGEQSVRFEMVDATGLPSPAAGHMHRAAFTFAGDRLTSAWTWQENGADVFTTEVKTERTASR